MREIGNLIKKSLKKTKHVMLGLKNFSEINTMSKESIYSRVNQMEDRINNPEDRI